jgi:hypothetical protein
MPAKFPAITLCSNDPFTTKYAEKVYDTFINETSYHLISKSQVDFDLNNLVLMHVSNPLAYDDDARKRLGFNRNLFFTCNYRNKSCTSDLHWYWSYTYGNCWQFNTGFNFSNNKIDIKNTTIEGREDGLTIALFPIVNENQYMTTWDNGMIVFVHNNQFKPLQTDAVYVEPGKTSFLSIKRTITHKSPYPYSDCVDLASPTFTPSDLYSFMKNSGQVYRQKDCFKLCQQQQIIAKFGCYNVEFSKINNFSIPCSNLSHLFCIKKEKINFNMSDCQKNACPLECDTIKYDIALSTLQNPSLKEYYMLNDKEVLNFSQLLGRNLSFDQFKYMWVNLRVFYLV